MPTHDPSHQAPGKATAQFTPDELAYLLHEPHLGRLATTDATAAPHVVPIGWSYNPQLGTIDISGRSFATTRKYRNAKANPQVAFVVDDVLPPFHPRCVMIQGVAQTIEADPDSGTEAMIRITPEKITSWGLDATPPS